MTQPRGNHFTLAELVVSLVVLGALFGILFPTALRKREEKKRAMCLQNLKQIVLGCVIYSQNYEDSLPFVANADDSNDHFDLTSMPYNYISGIEPLMCPADLSCRHYPKPRVGPYAVVELNAPNVFSYAYVSGLKFSQLSDSPLAGDNLMDVTRANDLSVQQFQKRRDCSTKGSNHGNAGGNVAFVDGHAEFNPGTRLKHRWVDAAGGTKNIQNPNGLQ